MDITELRLSVPAALQGFALISEGPASDWREQALCAQTDPESFFPDKGGSPREAKQVCLSCAVRVECLNDALDNDERFGVWGGLSEKERRKLKHNRIAHDATVENDSEPTYSAEASAAVRDPEGTAA